jgi:hypothetical protein
MLSGDTIPRKLYNNQADYQKIQDLLKPIAEEVLK